MCDGPCKHEFPRSEFVFPDRLKRSDDDPSRADDKAPKPPRPNRRGKRPTDAQDRAIHGPVEDRNA